MTHKTYRVNADSTDVLVDLLVGTPEEFNSDKDALRGRTHRHPMAGRLNGVEFDTFMAHRAQNRITYVIYSYATPIAWRVYSYGAMPSGDWDDISVDLQQHWVMPPTNGGTNTTAKHMGKVRAAISRIDAWHLAATSPPNV